MRGIVANGRSAKWRRLSRCRSPKSPTTKPRGNDNAQRKTTANPADRGRKGVRNEWHCRHNLLLYRILQERPRKLQEAFVSACDRRRPNRGRRSGEGVHSEPARNPSGLASIACRGERFAPRCRFDRECLQLERESRRFMRTAPYVPKISARASSRGLVMNFNGVGRRLTCRGSTRFGRFPIVWLAMLRN